MKRRILLATAGATAMLGAAAAEAHHSTAQYDYTASVTLAGTVKSVQWGNPHNYVQLFVPAGRDIQEWSIELGTPMTAAVMGWSRDTLKRGDKVVFVVAPMRNGDHGGTLKNATLKDGRQLSGMGANVNATNPFSSIPSLKRVPPK